jgi:hypothetical protein
MSEAEGRFFFFEKKKQKTFAHASGDEFTQESRMLPATDKSFLVLFFKKELLASFAT